MTRKSPRERRSGFVSGLLVGAAAALAGVALTFWFTGRELPGTGVTDEAREVIEANYFKEVSPAELEEASIRGLVDVLRKRYDDRFSHYFSPEEYAAFEDALSPEVSGIGVGIKRVPDGLRVATVYKDSPAEEAGLGVGDTIVAVEGEDIPTGGPVEAITGRIKGEPGTEVELTIDPAGKGPDRDVAIERAKVELPAANGEIRDVNGTKIAYVRFTSFDAGAHGELRAELQRLYQQGAEGLLLDVRGNGGGRLSEAYLAASVFVEDGPIVTTRSRTRGTETYEAEGEALDPRPTVVLVDRGSASATEILAAALDEYDLATVVGEPTLGKGTVQLPVVLDDGSAIDLTIAEYLTADGDSIAGKGVRPDVKAKDDPKTQADEALARGLDVLSGEVG